MLRIRVPLLVEPAPGGKILQEDGFGILLEDGSGYLVQEETISAVAYGTPITASAIPIGGATIADVFGRIDVITPSAIPIGGATITEALGFKDAITPASVPIGGATNR
jgi:hypothetical protein